MVNCRLCSSTPLTPPAWGSFDPWPARMVVCQARHVLGSFQLHNLLYQTSFYSNFGDSSILLKFGSLEKKLGVHVFSINQYYVQVSNQPLALYVKVSKKVSSYVAHYPILRIAQSALHFTSLTDLFTQTPFQLLWEASSHMQQLMREGCSYTYPPISTARYSYS